MPAQSQVVFDPDQTAVFSATSVQSKLNQIKLGVAEKQVWGRKFKIRLTSTDTGRKIDFNINFDLIKEKSKEQS